MLVFCNSRFYDVVARFKNHKHIQVTMKGEIINLKTNCQKRYRVKGRSLGVWLDSKTFITKSKIKQNLELIPIIKDDLFDMLGDNG